MNWSCLTTFGTARGLSDTTGDVIAGVAMEEEEDGTVDWSEPLDSSEAATVQVSVAVYIALAAFVEGVSLLALVLYWRQEGATWFPTVFLGGRGWRREGGREGGREKGEGLREGEE